MLHLLADGLTPGQIARQLGVTDRIVRRHSAALFAKLGAATAAQAVAVAFCRRILVLTWR